MITISYLPNNPSKITYSKFNTIPQILFFVGGSICIICSIACLVAIVINKFNCNKSKGNRLIAIIKEFDYRQNLRVFGKHPASLVCVDSIGNYYKTRFLYDKQKMIAVGSFVVVYVDEKTSYAPHPSPCGDTGLPFGCELPLIRQGYTLPPSPRGEG